MRFLDVEEMSREGCDQALRQHGDAILGAFDVTLRVHVALQRQDVVEARAKREPSRHLSAPSALLVCRRTTSAIWVRVSGGSSYRLRLGRDLMLSHKWLGALTSAVAACLLVAASSGGGGGLRHIPSAATSAASWVLAGVKMVYLKWKWCGSLSTISRLGRGACHRHMDPG